MIFLLLSASGMLNAQDQTKHDYLHFYRLFNEAQYACFQMDFQESRRLFQEAFALELPESPIREQINRKAQYTYAKVLAELGDTINAMHYLKASNHLAALGRDSIYFREIAKSSIEALRDSLFSKVKILDHNKKEADTIKLHPIVQQIMDLREKFRKQNYADYSMVYEQKDEIKKMALRDSLWQLSVVTAKQALDTIMKYKLAGHDQTGNYYIPYRNMQIFMAVLPEWQNENSHFLQQQIALGYLHPDDLRYGNEWLEKQMSDSLKTCDEHFRFANNYGITPYFHPDAPDPPRGFLPEKSLCHDWYVENKYRYNCTDQ